MRLGQSRKHLEMTYNVFGGGVGTQQEEGRGKIKIKIKIARGMSDFGTFEKDACVAANLSDHQVMNARMEDHHAD